MGTSLSITAALAVCVAVTGLTAAAAAPAFIPNTPKSQSSIVLVQNSVVIRRQGPQHDGGWNKRLHQRRDNSGYTRDRYDGSWQYRPRTTPKYAYDAYGNYRRYGGNDWGYKGGWDDWSGGEWHDGDRWDDRDQWDDNRRKHRLRVQKPRSFTTQGPSNELQDILTAVPE